jgi:hypothetical protein
MIKLRLGSSDGRQATPTRSFSMKGTRMKSILLLILSIITPPSFAMQNNRDAINQHCMSVAEELTQLANSNMHDRCASKVLRVASFMQTAGVDIIENQLPDAWMNLNSAVHVLIDVSKYKTDCAYFGPKSYHYLFEVNHIKEEIERLSY